MRDERGSVTFWVLGLVVVVLFVGGLSVDLWRAVSERRELAGMATAAAAAAASGIDTELWREAGQLRLDESASTNLAYDNLSRQPLGEKLESATVTVDPAGQSVTVRVALRLELTLLRLLGLTEGIPISAQATASPVVRG